jgi:cold shock CspA family protein
MTMLTNGTQRFRVDPTGQTTDARTAEPGRPIWSGPTPHTSTIKWYDPHPNRRFGFITPHDGGGDIWFNWLTLMKNNIDEKVVFPDMVVRYSFVEPTQAGKQRSVVHMKLEG